MFRHLLLIPLLLAAALPSTAEELVPKSVPNRDEWNRYCEYYLGKFLDNETRQNPQRAKEPETFALVLALQTRATCSCEYREHQGKETFTWDDVLAARDVCYPKWDDVQGLINEYLPDAPFTQEQMEAVMESATPD
ncbi:hypothetical protein [Synechococcus sp. ROS8604]|uniref:hypothetical protein n=1 Tax=Synechococcus sp. ROS8604 TaxID=1442557 RepID=UPI00164844B3|nr:hypothetical protein [Synechococcus sp. ROS8604]QNI89925.1 hypothetical protein SynROS8604_03317 [Synechococcus sp. ROS8604]